MPSAKRQSCCALLYHSAQQPVQWIAAPRWRPFYGIPDPPILPHPLLRPALTLPVASSAAPASPMALAVPAYSVSSTACSARRATSTASCAGQVGNREGTCGMRHSGIMHSTGKPCTRHGCHLPPSPRPLPALCTPLQQSNLQTHPRLLLGPVLGLASRLSSGGRRALGGASRAARGAAGGVGGGVRGAGGSVGGLSCQVLGLLLRTEQGAREGGG